MQDVTLADGVVAQEPDRFVTLLGARRRGVRPFVDTQELVVEHPLRFNVMVRVVTHDLASQFPCAGHVIHQIVVPLGRRLRTETERTC